MRKRGERFWRQGDNLGASESKRSANNGSKQVTSCFSKQSFIGKIPYSLVIIYCCFSIHISTIE
jgi:hypothetical protein